jgi:hypothetical protein
MKRLLTSTLATLSTTVVACRDPSVAIALVALGPDKVTSDRDAKTHLQSVDT